MNAMTIDKLKQQRESLKSRLAAIDTKIAKMARSQREAEQREILRLIQQSGITVARLSQMLDAAPGCVTE